LEQLAMAKIWHAVLSIKGAQWGVTNAEIDEMADFTENAEKALAKAMSVERTVVITAKCREAFNALIAFMRGLKNRKFFSPPLTDADFVSLGLKPKDTTQTPVPEPVGQAEADVTYPGPHLLKLHIKPLEGTRRDPLFHYGCRIYYGVMPHGGATLKQAAGANHYLMAAPVQGEDLPRSTLTRRKKETMVFSASDSGKTAYFCIRYENSKGDSGPWGPVFSAVIP
jgi:hypothetical protein